jgi:hypothetical protein
MAIATNLARHVFFNYGSPPAEEFLRTGILSTKM